MEIIFSSREVRFRQPSSSFALDKVLEISRTFLADLDIVIREVKVSFQMLEEEEEENQWMMTVGEEQVYANKKIMVSFFPLLGNKCSLPSSIFDKKLKNFVQGKSFFSLLIMPSYFNWRKKQICGADC